MTTETLRITSDVCKLFLIIGAVILYIHLLRTRKKKEVDKVGVIVGILILIFFAGGMITCGILAFHPEWLPPKQVEEIQQIDHEENHLNQEEQNLNKESQHLNQEKEKIEDEHSN